MRHLYLHVPFCARRCSYCDFSIAVRKRIPAREYLDAVLRELELMSAVDPGAAPRGPRELELVSAADPGAARRGIRESGVAPRGPDLEPLDTLYLGGGTPSLLPPEALATLVTQIVHAFGSTPSSHVVELTLEANPEDVTEESAKRWRAAGVNRVSLGAQSFDDRVLEWMHRSHDAARIGEAVRALRRAGIENISLDLIFALPAELNRDWSRDLELAVSLGPSHLSLYGLTVETRTPLARWISRGGVRPTSHERYAEEYLLAHVRLAACGYQFYEVSNACRDGYRSRHNSAYWSGHSYLGLGPAAHSYDGRARRWNVPAWEAYRRRLAEGRSPVELEEVLTPDQRELERLYLSLRTDSGLPLTACPPDRRTAWRGAGWVEVRGESMVCTPEGWLRLDALVGDLTGTSAAV